jgi:alanine racemase
VRLDGGDDPFADIQTARLYRVAAECGEAGVGPLFRHISDSEGIQRRPASDLDGVRAGLLAYGYPVPSPERPVAVAPVLQWKTRLLEVRDAGQGRATGERRSYAPPAATRLGLAAAGTRDGYPAAAAERAFALAAGRRCRVIGAVGLHTLTLDLGADSPARAGDEVVLLGAQGGESLWADALAACCGLDPRQLLAGLRVTERRETTFRAFTHPSRSQ